MESRFIHKFQSYGCIHSAYTYHLSILIVRTHVPFPPCPCTREVANMPRVQKVMRESIGEMVEMMRENRNLYDPTCADHMDATMLNNIWHSIRQCPITCSMFPALFSETLCNTCRPIKLHHSGVGSLHTDLQALYTGPGLWVILRMPLQTLFYGCMETHFTDADTDTDMDTDERKHSFMHFLTQYKPLSVSNPVI